MNIELNKTYKFEIKNFSFADITREELIRNFQDGRCCSWFMEPQITKWFPELSRVLGNKKNFTKNGLVFMPSSQLGTGRKFNESVAHEKAERLIYICCDIVDFPTIRVRFAKGLNLIRKYPKCRINKSLREEFFNDESS